MVEDDHQRRLPAAVYDLALRLGVKPEDNRPSVKLTQAGRIKRTIETDWWSHSPQHKRSQRANAPSTGGRWLVLLA